MNNQYPFGCTNHSMVYKKNSNIHEWKCEACGMYIGIVDGPLFHNNTLVEKTPTSELATCNFSNIKSVESDGNREPHI